MELKQISPQGLRTEVIRSVIVFPSRMKKFYWKMTEIWYQGVEAKFACFLMQLVMEMKEIWSQGMRAVELFVLWLFFSFEKKGTSIEIEGDLIVGTRTSSC